MMGQHRPPQASGPTATTRSSSQTSSWLSLPPPIRMVFNRFPIVTYEDNDLPQRSCMDRSKNTLHIFTFSDAELSPNPACLKWQLYLKMHRIPFATHTSTNHASPTGALPFLLPAIKSKRDPSPQAITSSKIQRWSETQGVKEETVDLRLEAYLSLIDQNIRSAWLYTLYLQQQNFESVARRLYVETASSQALVQTTLAYQLQTAAKEQLLRTRSFIDAEEIYEQVDTAFEALSTLLGEQDFFSNAEVPCLFDASLVAFTHLILEFANHTSSFHVEWQDDTLSRLLSRHDRLVTHRDRVIRFTEGNSKQER